MTRPNNNVWLHRFACALALATLFLVALGGVVTTKGVGMAVPDWPTTYGEHMFLFPPSQWMAGIFYEHSHRLWASLVGLLAAVFAIWTWARGSTGLARWLGITVMMAALALMGMRTPMMFVAMACACVGVIGYAIFRAQRQADRLRWLGVMAFAAVIIQGVLGGLRVLLDEHGWGTEFGIFHATLAQLFFLLVCSLALITSKWWADANRDELNFSPGLRLRRLLTLTTVLILGQLLLGATMRHQHQGLAVPDFPLAHGKIWPATDAASVAGYNAQRLEMGGENPITAFHIVVHMLHRLNGLVVLLAIIGCTVAVWKTTARGSALRQVAAVWCAVAFLQVTLGILSIWSQRKVDVTTAHVAVGALTFALGWMSVLVTRRLAAPVPASVSAPESRTAAPQLKHA